MGVHEDYHRQPQRWRPSAAQRRILDGVAAGESNAALAARLGLSPGTVKWHISQLLAETDCTDREELGRWWPEQRDRHPPALALLTGAHLVVTGAMIGVIALVVGVALVAVRTVSRPDAVAPLLSGGCGDTPLHSGTVPGWLLTASGNNVPRGLPFVIDQHSAVAGFFQPPLHAGGPQNPANRSSGWCARRGTARRCRSPCIN